MERRFITSLGYIALLVAIFYLGWRCGSSSPPDTKPSEVVERRVWIDTLRYGSIEPIRVEAVEPQPTKPTPTAPRDSVYHFRDTLRGRWSAEVVGRGVQLKSLTLLESREREVRSIITREVPKWDISLKAGLTPHAQWFGIGLERNFGRLSLGVDVGYDRWARQPYLGVAASFSLWRRY